MAKAPLQKVGKVGENVSSFYDKDGWTLEGDVTRDAILNEDLRAVAEEYVSRCRRRILRHLPSGGEKILDAASGPVQYPEYLEYSQNFKERHCVDMSQKALDQAREKLGERGRYLHGDLLTLDLGAGFDAVISLHTIYHIHRDQQEEAVLKLLRSCRIGAPLVIVYSNPKYLLGRCVRLFRGLIGKKREVASGDGLYFFSHPLSWWERFREVAQVEFYPWRSLSSRHQKLLLPDNVIGKLMFRALFWFEERFSTFFVRNLKFTTIVLRARENLEGS